MTSAPLKWSEIVVGLHPTAITFDKDSTRLYVANSNEDTISVIDLTNAHKAAPQIARIPVRPGKGFPFGSMPNGLALSPMAARSMSLTAAITRLPSFTWTFLRDLSALIRRPPRQWLRPPPRTQSPTGAATQNCRRR